MRLSAPTPGHPPLPAPLHEPLVGRPTGPTRSEDGSDPVLDGSCASDNPDSWRTRRRRAVEFGAGRRAELDARTLVRIIVTTPELPPSASRRPASMRKFPAQFIRLALCSREPLARDRNATVVFCSSDAAVITHGRRIPPRPELPSIADCNPRTTHSYWKHNAGHATGTCIATEPERWAASPVSQQEPGYKGVGGSVLLLGVSSRVGG